LSASNYRADSGRKRCSFTHLISPCCKMMLPAPGRANAVRSTCLVPDRVQTRSNTWESSPRRLIHPDRVVGQCCPPPERLDEARSAPGSRRECLWLNSFVCAGAIRRHPERSTGADEYMAITAPYPYVQGEHCRNGRLDESATRIIDPERVILAGACEPVTLRNAANGSVSCARKRVGIAIASRWSDTPQRSPLGDKSRHQVNG
jgi:hypothetical protein